MSEGKPPPKDKRSAPSAADDGDDSLDFSHIGPATPAAPPAAPVPSAKPRRRRGAKGRSGPGATHKITPGSDQPKPARAKRTSRVVLFLLVIALVAGYLMTRHAANEPAPSPPTAASKPPAYAGAPPSAPPPASTPSRDAGTPPQPPALPSSDPAPTAQAPALPPEFLPVFQAYTAKAAPKALAVAVNSKGQWAYASIGNHATQADANEEALAHCARLKAQSDIQESCRLYAVGDKVVW